MPTERSILLDIEERRKGEALTGAANDLDKLAAEVEKTDNKFQLFTRDMERVNAEVEKSSTKVTDLRTQIARTGDLSLFGDLRKEEANLKRLQGLAQDLQKDFHTVTNEVDNIPGAGEGLVSATSPALITGIAALVTAAAPPLGAIIAGAVVGTVGTGGIIGGVLAASHNPRVQSALKTFMTSIENTFFASGQSFVDPLLQALPSLSQAFKDLDLDKTFRLAAPDLLIIVGGLEDFAKNVMPGINDVLAKSGPFAVIAAKGFGELGTAVSEFLDNVSASPGALEGLGFTFDLLGGTIKGLGVSLKWLSDRFHSFNEDSLSAFSALDQGLSVFGVDSGPIHNITVGLENLTGESYNAQQATGAFSGSLDKMALGSQNASKSMDDLVKETQEFNQLVDDLINNSLGVDSAMVQVAKGFKDLKTALEQNGSAWGNNTDAALANEEAVIQQLQALERLREAEIKATGNTDAANKEYEQNVEKLLAMAKAAGISKDALDALAQKYVIQVELASSLPGIGQAIAAQFKGIENGGGLAGGGYAAPGTSHPVGEYGMEKLTVLPGGGAVVTPMGGRMGGDGASLSITLGGTTSGPLEAMFTQWMIKVLRDHVRFNGGSADQAFS